MTFTQVVQDIKKLAGIRLHSIRPGSEITILGVDDEKGSLVLTNAEGFRHSRSLNELKLIWDEMQIRPAVHVDEVLHGSGTSRNQPETILANLPYIEWLKVDNKKHITYVGKNTHAYGTLKQMTGEKAAQTIEAMMTSSVTSSLNTVIVTDDVTSSIESISNICAGKIQALSQNVYSFKTETDTCLIFRSDSIDLQSGTYSVIQWADKAATGRRVTILGQYYRCICRGSVNLLIKEK